MERSMNNEKRINYIVTVSLVAASILFTLAVSLIDVGPIGPGGARVGFAFVNQAFFDLVGVRLFWYRLTDWLGLAALAVAFGFAVLGLCQLVARRSLRRVDPDILLLGLLYLAVIGCYVFFEKVVINCRPILMGGYLEPSYPSSHTMIVVCVMSTAMMQFRARFRRKLLALGLNALSGAIILVTVIGRLISGVHWLTDIVGGLLISATLAALYRCAWERAR
jgi:undecaprenyl-diphosphatase